ncbi:E3 ubiquitin/ISG15 ligase TRIM25-like [Takifugu flavidus]|uniref:E3 ubiquitin/ISG15 ligase TRIM25-like n=1 Tax=Takifugu flavidus TaxID=433684 RepID=UPI0025441891|nr:E3 ubiquitin/ISG15 ligase TRIM25-like [Takifugu flavidus]XP_056878893.1 E3 ubiquitin/ISG15 ligase TRIM25-like [Takifugu flavidus]
MASSCEELLMCPICLLTYTEPITTPCGHNYCKACITEYLSYTDEPVCPLCKEALQTQSELKVNTALQNLVQHFSNITVSDGETPAEAWEVTCDMCCEPKLKAQRSCLKCVASYCQHHLEQHQRVATFKQHQLVDPVSNLEAHVCRDHNKLLTSFCEKDQTCVCATCLKENHLRHQTVPLEHAFRVKKDVLVHLVSAMELIEMYQRSRMEDLKCSVEQSRREWEKEVEEIDQAWNSLAACLQRGQTELAELVQERQKAIQVKNDCLVASLEQDIAKLQSKRGELELVLQKGDQMYLLQNFASLNKKPHVPETTREKFHSSLNNDVNLVKKSVEQMQAKLSEEMEMLKLHILPSPP